MLSFMLSLLVDDIIARKHQRVAASKMQDSVQITARVIQIIEQLLKVVSIHFLDIRERTQI